MFSKQVGLPCINKKWSTIKKNMFHKHIKTHTVQDNIPDTALNVCVLGSLTFLYT